jgi:hypothetical protein
MMVGRKDADFGKECGDVGRMENCLNFDSRLRKGEDQDEEDIWHQGSYTLSQHIPLQA